MGISFAGLSGGGGLADEATLFLLDSPTGNELDSFLNDEENLTKFKIAVAGPHMNGIAANQTARSSVLASNTAMADIDTSSIGIGKLVAGIVGLSPSSFADIDAVAASQTAMDAVVASQTALDTVVVSQLAMDAVAASETATNALTLQNLPFGFNNAQAAFNPSVGFIKITRLGPADTNNFIDLASTIDLTGKNTLRVPASANTLGDSPSRMRAVVRINGSEVLNLSGDETTVVNRDIDISSFSGPCSIEFGYSSSNFGGSGSYLVQYGPWFIF